MNKTDEIYQKELLKKVKEIENGLIYYINRNKELENENKIYKKMYEHRVNEYLEYIKEN